MKKHNIFLRILLAGGIVLSLTGCAGKKEKETEPQTQAQTQVFTEKETETEKPTEAPTEPQTEKPLSLRDLKVKVLKSQREGTLSYEIADGSGVHSASMNFQSDASSFEAEGGDKAVYTGKRLTASNAGFGWKEMDGDYKDLWSLIYDDSCEMAGRTEINGKNCYHLITDSDEVSGYFTALCGAEGYSDVMIGEIGLDYYIDPDSFEIVRTTANMQFQAMEGNTPKQGQISVTFNSSNTQAVSITEPVVMPETESEVEDSYEPGSILLANNAYRNSLFDLQVVGGDVFAFSSERTSEIAESYLEAGSSYLEEAYAEGDGSILNIVTIKAGDKNRDQILEKYLTDSMAEQIQMAGMVENGSVSWLCSTATINGTQTKSYCAIADDRAIIMTVYYTDPGTVSTLEENLYGFDANPFWHEETWTMGGIVDVTTPEGFSIVQSDSTDLYACMRSDERDVNIFIIQNGSIDSEVQKESSNSANTTREVIRDDYIESVADTQIRYLAVHNSEPSLDYYTYVGLLQKDTVIVKYYVVSTERDADYTQVFSEFAQKTVVHAGEETASDEDLIAEEYPEETMIE